MIGRERFNNRPSKPTPKQGTPPTQRVEIVTCACGHTAEFHHFPDKQDKHRDNRRKKLTDRPCAECRQKTHLETIKRQQAEAARSKAEKGGKPGLFRLPHGSRFVTEPYDAEKQLWSITLIVPQADGTEQTFRSDGTAFHSICMRLGQQWQRWSREAAAK